ncbi:MAG: hypothetical protein N2690_07220, partial [Rhodocyclaceae bacterium]|nr:hypothetical protein [Rhodocyclaceae bacterium]
MCRSRLQRACASGATRLHLDGLARQLLHNADQERIITTHIRPGLQRQTCRKAQRWRHWVWRHLNIALKPVALAAQHISQR